MRHPIVLAALAGGLCFVVGCVVLVVGMRMALVAAANDLGHAVSRHGEVLQSAVKEHGGAIATAGSTIAHPSVKFEDPIQVKEPLKIRGIHDDGTLPVAPKVQ